MTRAVRLIRKHGFLPGNGLEALVEEALSSDAPDQSERVSRLEEALKSIADWSDAALGFRSCAEDMRKTARSALNQDSSNG